MLEVRRYGELRISFRDDENGGGGGLRMPRRPRFEMGRTLITSAAQSVLHSEDVTKALSRHHIGDWGDLDDEDKQSNERALKDGSRLFSAYHDSKGRKFYIITEWDRSLTTVLLPSDY